MQRIESRSKSLRNLFIVLYVLFSPLAIASYLHWGLLTLLTLVLYVLTGAFLILTGYYWLEYKNRSKGFLLLTLLVGVLSWLVFAFIQNKQETLVGDK